MQKKMEHQPRPQLPLLLLCSGSVDIHQALLQFVITELDWEHGLDHPDVHLINAPDEALSIDQVRKLRQVLTYQPYQASTSLVVIHDISSASIPAQNALLKMLEEPPSYVTMLLVCHNQQGVLPTILSRCLVVPLPGSEQVVPEKTIAVDLASIEQQTVSQLIELAEQYSDRPASLQLINQLIRQETGDLNPPSKRAVVRLHILLRTKQLLEKNVNVRLALEHCFFQLKQTV